MKLSQHITLAWLGKFKKNSVPFARVLIFIMHIHVSLLNNYSLGEGMVPSPSNNSFQDRSSCEEWIQICVDGTRSSATRYANHFLSPVRTNYVYYIPFTILRSSMSQLKLWTSILSNQS